MSMELPQPIAAYFIADRGKGETVAACFTPDAVVQDEGHTHRGLDEIRNWRADVAAKYTYTCEPFEQEQHSDVTIVTCRLEGNFPGSPVNLRFFFRLDGGKISSLEVIP
ncbi:MAG: nuclear transport factor 2 family protein [Planctomycetaceae bacterium]|nr:nuclear transport factor 2 family protein [Planctomycetaceae bacterium]